VTRDEAEKLNVLLFQILAKLDESAAFVRDRDTDEHWQTYRRSVGKAMADVALDLAEPLWKRFPELKPVQLGGSYEADPKIYEPRFYESPNGPQ